MVMRRTFLEKPALAQDDVIDHIEQLLRDKFNVKTGFADPNQAARATFKSMKALDTTGDDAIDLKEFRLLMQKMNCGDNMSAVDGLFHRYDTTDAGKLNMKAFANSLHGLRHVPQAHPKCRAVIHKVRELLLHRGENGYRGLVRILRRMDDNGNKKLSPEEVLGGLQTYGLDLSAQDLKTLFTYFDRDGDKQIDITEFMAGLRPSMSPARLSLVKIAFTRLDKNPDGNITIQELRSIYETDRHPQVLDGTKTPTEVLQDFNDSWDKDGDDIVTEAEFIEYYKDLSASIDNDQYFELMIRNAWHIAGGSGSGANTSNLRVLVTHTDGSQEVECIINDLGLPDHNERTLITALKKQGVTDILKVETSF